MMSSRSLEEEYYEYDGFWNPSLSPLGVMDQSRVRTICRLLGSDTQSVLDVGCGNGIFCNFVQRQHPSMRVVGFDRSAAALQYVETEKMRGNIDRLPYQDDEFDCVTALEVFEHLPIPIYLAALEEIARVAKKNIIISVPNNQVLGSSMTSCPGCKSIFDPDLHLRSFDRAKLATLFLKEGFTCGSVEVLGERRNYRGIHSYLKLQRYLSREPEAMRSPLCPICGYTNHEFLRSPSADLHRKSRLPALNSVKQRLKGIWPESVSYRWLVGIYVRQMQT